MSCFGVTGQEAEAVIREYLAVMLGPNHLSGNRAYDALDALVAERDALLDDALTLMDQTASDETQMEARRRIIERHGKVSA
jgi:hypothetical protein